MGIIKNKFFWLILGVTLVVLAIGLFWVYKKQAISQNAVDASTREEALTLVLAEEELEIQVIKDSGDRLMEEAGFKEEVGVEAKKEGELLETDAQQLDIKGEEEQDQGQEQGQVEVNNEEAGVVDRELLLKEGESETGLEPDNNSGKLKIGFVTDLHVKSGSNGGGERLLGDKYAERIDFFVERMDKEFKPNFILINGDVIEGTHVSAKKGGEELAMIKKVFSKTEIQKYWVVGNHDLRSVNKKQWMKSLGTDYLSTSFVVGDYQIIILDTNFDLGGGDIDPEKTYTRGNVSEEQLRWLRRELKKNNKKKIVFMHHPPLWNVDTALANRSLFNAQALQEVFTEYKVMAVFAGHVEDLFYKEIEGVDYFVCPGLIKHPKYQGAFLEITMEGKKMVVDMNYLKENGEYRTVRMERR